MTFYVYIERDEDFDARVLPGMFVKHSTVEKLEVTGHSRPHMAIQAIERMVGHTANLRMSDNPERHRTTVVYTPSRSMNLVKAIQLIEKALEESEKSHTPTPSGSVRSKSA